MVRDDGVEGGEIGVGDVREDEDGLVEFGGVF